LLKTNRIYWAYDDGAWWRPTPYKDARVIVPKYKKSGANIKEDMFKLAKKFAKDHESKKFYIAMSGGIDSELVADTFVQLNIPFTAITLNLFDQNYNDTSYAKVYCRSMNIEHKIINLDYKQFLTKVVPKAIKYGQFTNSLSQVALTVLIDYVSKDDIIIFSGHNPDFTRNGVGWYEDSPNLVKYAINTRKNFFTFTSLEPIFIHYLKNYAAYEPGQKDNAFIYKEYPDLIVRPKQTGWEKLGKLLRYKFYLLPRPVREDGMKGQVFLTWK
jgi:hypothetical protein